MILSRREAIDYLHLEKGYSRRISAKLVDVALENNDSTMMDALRKSLEKGIKKSKKDNFKYIVRK